MLENLLMTLLLIVVLGICILVAVKGLLAVYPFLGSQVRQVSGDGLATYTKQHHR